MTVRWTPRHWSWWGNVGTTMHLPIHVAPIYPYSLAPSPPCFCPDTESFSKEAEFLIQVSAFNQQTPSPHLPGPVPTLQIVTWGMGWGVFRSLREKAIEVQSERKVNILHKRLPTALQRASGSALLSLCQKSERVGAGVHSLRSTNVSGEWRTKVSGWREDFHLNDKTCLHHFLQLKGQLVKWEGLNYFRGGGRVKAAEAGWTLHLFHKHVCPVL